MQFSVSLQMVTKRKGLQFYKDFRAFMLISLDIDLLKSFIYLSVYLSMLIQILPSL